MAINKQTIISVFDDKLTLLQWLKTINKALDEAVLTGVEVRQKGNATYSFVVTFEDGTELESNEFVLAQGESINGATIRNGHLYLSLTNGDELDAGNLKPVTSFAITESQHLIVNYGDGTSQDLGAIFNGNVNVDGNFTANSIIENMSGYSGAITDTSGSYTKENAYLGVVKTGNKITFVISLDITKLEGAGSTLPLAYFIIPQSVGAKILTSSIGANLIDNRKLQCFSALQSAVEVNAYASKNNNTQISFACIGASMVAGTKYHVRYEATFLLSDNLVGN